MVTHAPARQSRVVFRAIADPTRREILDLLKGGALSAGELARRFPVSRPAVSRHLRVLRGANLVHETREAQRRLYSLNPAPLAQIDRWISSYRVFWGARLHDLKRYVEGVGAQTRVTIIHGGFSRPAHQSDYPFGWRSFLEQLKSEAETHS